MSLTIISLVAMATYGVLLVRDREITETCQRTLMTPIPALRHPATEVSAGLRRSEGLLNQIVLPDWANSLGGLTRLFHERPQSRSLDWSSNLGGITKLFKELAPKVKALPPGIAIVSYQPSVVAGIVSRNRDTMWHKFRLER